MGKRIESSVTGSPPMSGAIRRGTLCAVGGALVGASLVAMIYGATLYLAGVWPGWASAVIGLTLGIGALLLMWGFADE